MQLASKTRLAPIDLIARIAHDIASPIAIMELSLPLIEKNKVDINLLRAAIQRLRDITNYALEQYRNSSIVNSPQFSPLLEEVISLKRFEWLNQSCKLLLFSSVCSSVKVNGAASEIKSLLSNLLNNALESCKSNALIQVCANHIDGFIVLTISDNGSGISVEKIDAYLKGESSKHAGPGLGLVRAKKYMEDVGGTLLLLTQKRGTTVKLTFKIDCN